MWITVNVPVPVLTSAWSPNGPPCGSVCSTLPVEVPEFVSGLAVLVSGFATAGGGGGSNGGGMNGGSETLPPVGGGRGGGMKILFDARVILLDSKNVCCSNSVPDPLGPPTVGPPIEARVDTWFDSVV